MKRAKILIIGGSNVDMLARSDRPLISGDSNPGSVSLSFGGVGRNVAENLARLGDEVTLITGIGNDSYGRALVKELENLEVNVVYPKAKCGSSSYIAICNSAGDMEVAVCDSRAIDNLGASFIVSNDDLLEGNDYVFFDTNLPEETIEAMIQKYPDKKWCAEAVSANKVSRLSKVLKKLFLFKGNLLEAQKAVGKPENTSIQSIMSSLKKAGIRNAVITEGSKNIYYFDEKEKREIESIPVEKIPADQIVNLTGAGDAMFAGIAHGLVKGWSLHDSIVFGGTLSCLAIKSERAVSWEVSNLCGYDLDDDDDGR
jgi:pseudouridine kinase